MFCSIRCYWGYAFESLATENAPSHVDANVEYCSVIKTKLGAHRIIMGAEMDCCDSTDDGRKFYIELKTSREVAIDCMFVVMLGFSCGTGHFFHPFCSLTSFD